MKIYLAGPMTGIEQFNFPEFERVTTLLRACGHAVFSPAERERQAGFDPKTGVANTMAHYMAFDLPEVCKADAVALLPDWEKSSGASLEVEVALRLGKMVHEWQSFCPRETVPTKRVSQGVEWWLMNERRDGKWLTESVQGGAAEFGELSRGATALPGENPKDVLGQEKVPLRLVPPALSVYVAEVMAHGARKYGEWNWRKTKVRHTVYLEAALRHILQALDGEERDSESGLPHEAHAAACMGIVLDAAQTGMLVDDRDKSGTVPALMKSLTRSNGMPHAKDAKDAKD